MFTFGGSIISWRSKQKTTVAQSIAEAEIIALSLAIRELLWLKKLEPLLPPFQSQMTVLLKEDNHGCTAVAQSGVVNDRTKHISVKEQMVIGNIENGNLKIEWTPTDKQKADWFTMSLDRIGHTRFLSQLGLRSV